MNAPNPMHINSVETSSGLRKAIFAAGSVLAGFCLAVNSVSAQTLMEFNFNEGTGSTVKSADGKLIGTFVGTPAFSPDSPSGLEGDYSMEFATGQRVTVPDPSKVLALDTANPNFTIQAWLKFATPTARSVFFYNNGPGASVSASVFTDRSAYVTTLGVKDQQSAALIPDDGTWHHYAVVHEAKKEFRFYVDGVLGDTVPYTSSVIFTRTNQIFYIGAESTGGLQYVGLLDRLRYTKGILTPAQLDSQAIPADARPRGAVYAPPAGGWKYIFDGHRDKAGEPDSGFTSLDGTWSHDNGSDQFDGSKLGGTIVAGDFGVGNSPGGMMSITEGAVTFLRMQDPGNPSQYGFPDPPSNRKIFFGHDLTTTEKAPDTLLDDGVTISFRARIPTPKKATGPLDQLYRAGQSAAGPKPYPDAGDGYLVSDGGKGNVTIKQGGGGAVAFALTLPDDTFGGDPAATKANFSGLTMNKLNGVDRVAAVNFDSPGEDRRVPFDPTDWHEFWITIKADTTGVGNYQVQVFMDGSTQPTTLIVTSGNGDDFSGISYLAIGGSRTDESWALDLDFVAYKVGADVPTKSAEPPKFSPITRQGDKIVVSWTGGGTLQAADNVGGPYADVAGASSPLSVTLSGTQKFYRLKQ